MCIAVSLRHATVYGKYPRAFPWVSDFDCARVCVRVALTCPDCEKKLQHWIAIPKTGFIGQKNIACPLACLSPTLKFPFPFMLPFDLQEEV